MSEGLISAGLWGLSGGSPVAQREPTLREQAMDCPALPWDPARFAREQIRSLVRQVFSPAGPRPVRQVVFSAAEAPTDVQTISMLVAEILASEFLRDTVVLGGYAHGIDAKNTEWNRGAGLRRSAACLRSNVWLLPATHSGEDRASATSLCAYLSDVRREFEFSIVAAPSAEESGDALAMARFADGIVLVLSAQHTRRVTAAKIKENLEAAQVRLLGTVLTDREFPIPAGIYRRL